MNLLELKNVTVTYGSNTVLRNVSLDLASGDWLMIVGPNGAGKSTLISAISGVAPYTGEILLSGTDRNIMKARDIARCTGTLTQSHSSDTRFPSENW